MQYYNFVYFEWLVQHKAEVEKKIRDFFEHIKDKIPHDCYVVDFALIDDKLHLIELNPFV
jgi:hypothetical protein